MITPTIHKDGKEYFIEWDKENGTVCITECVPTPTAEEIQEVINNMTEEEFKGATVDDVLQIYTSQHDGPLETYDFKEVIE